MNSTLLPANVESRTFNCPHCGAYAGHTWYRIYASTIQDNEGYPVFLTEDDLRNIEYYPEHSDHYDRKTYEHAHRVFNGEVLLDHYSNDQMASRIENIHFSQCQGCGQFSMWTYKDLAYPQRTLDISPNPDLPEDITRDFEEARSIATLSPRGAAALLRLAIQKLCAHLGTGGKNINSDIGYLVKKGLPVKIQQALDVVRLTGNAAVHPGELDLSDDIETVESLFRLTNIIAQEMISNPKDIEELYSKLPSRKLEEIEKRDL